MKYVLCGYMGSGKSHIGNLLAAHTHYPFKDLDSEIERREKMEIQDIFKEKGEIYFRKAEKKALEDLIDREEDFILSLGGGTPCYGNNLDVIKHSKSTLIYLKLSVDHLTERLWKEKEKRPVISKIASKEKLNEFIRKHLFERGFYYNQSDLILEVDQLGSEKAILESITGA